MGTAYFACGCWIKMDMFSGETIEVDHCQEHKHLFSQDKSLSQMVIELRTLQQSCVLYAGDDYDCH